MIKNVFLLFILFALLVSSKPAFSQVVCTISITGVKNTIAAPVSVDLDEITSINDSLLQLVRIDGSRKVPVSFQVANSGHRRLWWMVKKENGQQVQKFELITGNPGKDRTSEMRIAVNNGELVIKEGNKNILQYNFKTVYPPAGVDTAFKRSGFIHPLWSPGGNVLTRISPPDHYHHFGIWNPWTKVLYKGKTIDFWNLKEKQGTVRFAKLIEKNAGPVFAGFDALQEHVVLNNNADGEVALNEQWEINAFNIGDKMRLIDFTSTLNCSADEPVILKEYRYGGFGFRATEEWNNKNSRVLTSEGHDRKTSDSSTARWCITEGAIKNSRSGIVFMGHPANYNFPEPVRVWPENMNDRGDVFFSFSPTKNKDWYLGPGKNHVLRYRMLVYDGTITKEKAEEAWQSFAKPFNIVVTKSTGTDWPKVNVLVYTKNGKGYVHKNIPAAVAAIRSLGKKYGFHTDVSDDPSVFTDENLKKYSALIFTSTNNDVFDTDAQKVALMRYTQAGGGFVGIHSVTGTERNWEWFKRLVGGTFVRHAEFQKFKQLIVDSTHPSTNFLPQNWENEDECYYIKTINPDLHVLLAHDLNSVSDNDKPVIYGNSFPSAWCHQFDGGRQWYTSLGHDDKMYSDDLFLKHIMGGIEWTVNGNHPLDYSKAHATTPNDPLPY